MPPKREKTDSKAGETDTKSYRHTEAELLLRPDVGTQAQFRKKKPPVTYRYDSSLSPSLEWDGQNHARELGEWLIGIIEKASRLQPPHTFDKPQEFKNTRGQIVVTVRGLHDAVEQLKRIGRPFLNWAGKAERLSFDVPTLPLFVHERLSTKAIIETLKSHRKKEETQQLGMFELFGDPQRSVTDQVLRAYEYKDKWVNRMVLGDSLVVMSSLLHYEGLGGQVQMIYSDPPYGIKFGSNFQPFIRKRDVSHNDDEDMTREPEMVKAYRDTWELGLHSYLTYMRDRLLLARELLHPSGSVFVQISDENLHHVRELMDEVFGEENFVSQITFKKSGSQTSDAVPSVADFIVQYCKDRSKLKFRPLFVEKKIGMESTEFRQVILRDGSIRSLTKEELTGQVSIPEGARIFKSTDLHSRTGSASTTQPYEFQGKPYCPREGAGWRTNNEGLKKLEENGRLLATENSLRYIHLFDDFPYSIVSSVWDDVMGEANILYVVQTNLKVIQRCMLMTTDPGDLVLDPTCGSGTTSYVAEQWGRRWITIDTSRVPLALARQRLLTATFPYYELKDESRGPAGGFVYKRKKNNRGEETGGIVPHVTLKSIANNEPPSEEILVDRPEVDNKITRVTGHLCVEATIPTPVDWEGDGVEDSGVAEDHSSFVDRMLEVLRKSPLLHIGGGRTVALKNIRPPAKTLSLTAEAMVEATAPGQSPTLSDVVEEANEKNLNMLPLSQRPVALLFGPENGAVSEKLVYEALTEAKLKSYSHLYVIGFAIQSNARMLIEKSAEMGMIPATYVQATPDLMMGDLLKNMRSSQIFSVCGLPEIKLTKIPLNPPLQKGEVGAASPPFEKGGKGGFSEQNTHYQVELLGLDIFDPVTMDNDHRSGNDVPAWFLDTDYNGLCFHVCQAFFPRTGAWDNLKRALKGSYEETVWDHLAGTKSVPFEAGEHGQVAVKVIDDRGNELMVVKGLKEAEG